LWDTGGPAATFLAGAAFTALSGVGLIALLRRDAGDAGNPGDGRRRDA